MARNTKKTIYEFFELRKKIESKKHTRLTLETLQRIRESGQKIGTIDLLE